MVGCIVGEDRHDRRETKDDGYCLKRKERCEMHGGSNYEIKKEKVRCNC